MTKEKKIIPLEGKGKMILPANLPSDLKKNILSDLYKNPEKLDSEKDFSLINSLTKRIEFNYTKNDFRAILIIYLLSDGNKYKQTEIKDLINSLQEKVLSEFGNAKIFEYIGYCSEIIFGSSYSGHVSDVSVSRVVNHLKKEGIIDNKAEQMGQGAPSVFNWLKKDIFSFFNMLKFLNSFPGSLDNVIFISLGRFLINSPYGQEIINKESIEKMLKIIPGDYSEEDKENIIKITQISPTSLLNLLELYVFAEERELTAKWSSEEKESIKERLLTDMVINIGKDIKNPDLHSPHPIQYSITADFNGGKIKKIKPKNYEVNDNKIKIYIKKT